MEGKGSGAGGLMHVKKLDFEPERRLLLVLVGRAVLLCGL